MDLLCLGIASTAPLAEIAERIAPILGLSLHARESSYWGEPYFSGPLNGSSVQLIQNCDPMYDEGIDPPDERWFASDAVDCPALLLLEVAEADPRVLCERFANELRCACRVLGPWPPG